MNNVYDTKEAFQVYCTYLAMRQHFTSSYDYFKYGGKIKASKKSFETRKDRFFFFKLSKKKNWKELILSNVIINPKMWVGKMMDTEAEKNYLEWKGRQEAFSHHFREDIKKMNVDFNANFLVKDGQNPTIIRQYICGEISLDTITALTCLINCQKIWEKTIVDTIVFPDIMYKIEKYKPWLDLDLPKLKEILLTNFKEHK